MKKILLALTLWMTISVVTHAQSPNHDSKDMHKMEKKMKLKDGVMMVDNMPMLCSKKACSPLKNTYKCSDGCTVSADGTITKPDGTSMKLMNGYQIDHSGTVAMIMHGEKGHVCDENCPMMKSKK